MARSDFLQANDDAFAAQLQAFKTNIGSYGAVLGVTPAQITAQAADADYFAFTLACQQIARACAAQWTVWKQLTRDGGSPPPTGVPVVPSFPDDPGVVAPGVEVRFRALVKAIKAHAGYNVSVGEALGIEGATQVGPDLATVTPVLGVKTSGNRVEVAWGWQGFAAYLELCEIQVDRGGGQGFGPLAFDTTPGYVDTAPFPAAPAKWTYRAIYRVNDAQVGQWSNPVSVVVGG